MDQYWCSVSFAFSPVIKAVTQKVKIWIHSTIILGAHVVCCISLFCHPPVKAKPVSVKKAGPKRLGGDQAIGYLFFLFEKICWKQFFLHNKIWIQPLMV